VGAPELGTFQGSAYVFKKNGVVWSEEAILTSSKASNFDDFGTQVAISGNYSLVGAPGEDTQGSGSGSAFVFRRNGSTWIEEAELTASDAAVLDALGTAVDIQESYAIVGAPSDDDKGSNSGSAYIFKRDGSNWTELAKLTASDGAGGDIFGSSVGIFRDYAVVGAPFHSGANGFKSGAVYVYFRQNDSTWNQIAKLIPAGLGAADEFGASIDLLGDDLIIGATETGNGSPGNGSAYVYVFDGVNWVEEAKLIGSGSSLQGDFGTDVAIVGDTALVGAPGEFPFGGTYVFTRNGSTWAELCAMETSDRTSSDRMGSSVALDTGSFLVGIDNGRTLGQLENGSAYVFGPNPCTNTPLPVEVLSFQGKTQPQGVQLTWITEKEKNLKGYQVNRLNNIEEWENIGWIQAQAVADKPLTYRYMDKHPLEGENTYQIIAEDIDGSRTASDAISVFHHPSPLIHVYPNPTNDFLIIHPAKTTEVLTTSISTPLGKVLWKKEGDIRMLSLSHIPEGIYLLHLSSNQGNFQKKIVIRRP